MGDWFQAVVDCDASESEAPALAAAIQKWLVNESIVCATKTDCVLSYDTGYPPGPHCEKVTSRTYSAFDFRELQTNGLHIITERRVYDSGQGGMECVVCRACSGRFEPPDSFFDATIMEWFEKKGPGIVACSQCGIRKPIGEWDYEPQWGFGNLGLMFWNWPPLEKEFVERIRDRLKHRVVLVAGKL